MNLFNVFLKCRSALASLFLFVLGNGFCSTYMVSVQTHLHTSPFLIGLMTTSAYAGLVIGSFKIETIIFRIAHIRSYAAFASAITAFCLLCGMFVNIYFWIFIRFLTGIAVAGVFIVIESWLLSQATEKTRGQILSLYMVVFYASQALAQLFLKYESAEVLFLFAFIAISSSLSVIPLTMTKTETPNFGEPSTLKLSKIYKKCASGLYASMSGGLLMGSIYGLFPTFLVNTFHSVDRVALYMFSVIFGGMLFQYPIGKVSDVIERRTVLIYIGIASLVLSLAMPLFSGSHYLFLILCALFGGFTFTIYPVSISHACDSLSPQDTLSGIQTLLLTYSIGAMLGPVFASAFMLIPYWGLFAYYVIILSTLIAFLSWRKRVVEDKDQEEAFIAYPQITPVSSEIDPRNEQAI